MTPQVIEMLLQYGIAGVALYMMYRINQGLRDDILHVLEEIRDKLP
ncbi:hypothetical protein ES705_42525 [subsurface metagenome]